MNKADFIRKIAKEAGISQAKARVILEFLHYDITLIVGKDEIIVNGYKYSVTGESKKVVKRKKSHSKLRARRGSGDDTDDTGPMRTRRRKK